MKILAKAHIAITLWTLQQNKWYASGTEQGRTLRGNKDSLETNSFVDDHENNRHLRTRSRGYTLAGINGENTQTKQAEGIGKINVLVKYRSDQGKMMAVNHSLGVYNEFAHDKTLALQVNASSFAFLQSITDLVDAVEEDSTWVAQGYLEERFDLSNNRHLQEEVPWGITMIQAPYLPIGPRPPRVCIVDTGVALGHPDLDSTLLRGRDRYAKSDNTLLQWSRDRNGHGTCLTGIINAVANNNIGVRGDGRVPVYITRGMKDDGSCRESDVLEALDQCASSGSRIISISLGGRSLSTTFKNKLDYLYDTKGMLIFAAAGNDGTREAMYPAAYPKVVSVGAVNSSGLAWHASNTGPWVEIAAPGDRIRSTSVQPDGTYDYASYSGTSMATPHAAAVAALLWSYFPYCINTQIRYAMAITARDVNDGSSTGGAGCDEKTGNGIVQARSAFNWLRRNPCQRANWGRDGRKDGCNVLK